MLLKLCCSLFKIGDIRLKCGLQHCTNTDTLLRRQLLRIEKNINFWIMWYLLVSLCIIIGQFSRSYFTVPLTKFKHLKCSPSIWTQRYNENLSNLLMLGGIVNYWTLFFSSWIYGLHLGQKYQWKKHGLWLTVQTWNLVSKRFFNFYIRLSELGGERFSSFKLPLPSLPSLFWSGCSNWPPSIAS